MYTLLPFPLQYWPKMSKWYPNLGKPLTGCWHLSRRDHCCILDRHSYRSYCKLPRIDFHPASGHRYNISIAGRAHERCKSSPTGQGEFKGGANHSANSWLSSLVLLSKQFQIGRGATSSFWMLETQGVVVDNLDRLLKIISKISCILALGSYQFDGNSQDHKDQQ
jgi:hypothetical protein